MTTINDILAHFRSIAPSNRELGDKFERLIANYLLADPQYADRLSDVWLWGEWPERSGADVGIDLVARERGTGDYWAIQCKFYDPAHTLQKADIDSFFTASGKRFPTKTGERGFSHRIIVSTTDKWSKHAEDALVDQSIPVTRLWFKDLAESPIDWAQFNLANVKDIRLKPKKDIRDHQGEAIGCVIDGLEEADRGKLIMACGTGKTFTALRLMERITPATGRVLFLAPSISLVSQSLREWTAEAIDPIDVPALDAVVFFDTRESIVDIVQSVGRVMRKSPGKQFGYIILPVCIPSKKVEEYNTYIESDVQFKGIWKVIKALRAHDESLVDEAEFRRKIKVITDRKKPGDERDGHENLNLPLGMEKLPIDAINEAVYAAIPKKLGDREYWSEWAKSIGQIADRLIARIHALLAADKAMARDFATFLKGLQDTLNPAVSEAEAIEMLAQHMLTLPVFQALFAGSQFPDND